MNFRDRPAPEPKRGPSLWESIKDDPTEYGPEHDYTLTELDDKYTILRPVSNAALQWCYRYIPEWIGRYSTYSYKLLTSDVRWFVPNMRKDNLLSPQDYADRMSEDDNQRNQRHDDR